MIRLSPKGKHKSFRVGNRPNASGPDFICAGPDGALWFTEDDNDALGRLTTNGKYTEFPTGREYAQPAGLAVGPDNAFWFTDFSGHAGIGRMTTKGRTHFYSIPGSFTQPSQITSGPDGNMWFTTFISPPAVGKIAVR